MQKHYTSFYSNLVSHRYRSKTKCVCDIGTNIQILESGDNEVYGIMKELADSFLQDQIYQWALNEFSKVCH